ncbi:Lipoate-protein ligase B [Nitrococcus mobilis Nb-231]|uniref:Octanoyltransferase n=2 Tax=Nitrococcus mobilis TaxID=35797 RepID=A4BLW8_9GAMM|nr:Lipoate-protein ligase B [Nitrococcus mobilis Nb-231]
MVEANQLQMMATAGLRVRELGRVEYEPTWRAMQAFTADRSADTEDELWLLEHPPIFTLGVSGKREHILTPGAIPVLAVDRGGQVTYHGPGQVVAYTLVDLRRRDIGVRSIVSALENTVIRVLAGHGIAAHARREAPGVYVGAAKIAAVGLRVRRGCTYHGLAFNVAMELEPFSRINPCGYPGLAVTDLREQGVELSLDAVGQSVARALANELSAARVRSVNV